MTGFLMECWELGILNSERTDGIDLSWGNWKGAAQILHDMADGKRFGVLAGRASGSWRTTSQRSTGPTPAC
jgi:hypothetical protein